MQLRPIIPLVDSLLGGSVISEEYKGNFSEARQIADAALSDARKQGNKEQRGGALLASGVVRLLQGEPAAALRYFSEVEEVAPTDHDRRLRALNYASLATYCKYNLFPDGGGAGGTELPVRWNGVEYERSEAVRREAVFSKATDKLARFESWVVRDLLCNLLPARSFVQTSQYSASGDMTRNLLGVALQGPANFRGTMETYDGNASLRAFADLASADLCKRAGDTGKGFDFLNRALRVYEENGDVAGVGACRMMHGDWLAAPFSTPLVWNFAIQEGNSGGSDLAWTLEAAEFDLGAADFEGAESEYGEADRLFKSARAPRGLAHIYLRRGYLAFCSGDYESVVKEAARAQQDFASSGDLFGYWLAQAHRVLARICAGQFQGEGAIAESIGTWGAGDGSFSYALGLGLLFGRVGRHWVIRKGGHEQALACYRLAETLFRKLGARVNECKSLVDQGNICRALGERAGALILYEQALDRYGEDISARPAIADAVRPQTVMLANDVYLLYLDGMDSDGMERSAERLATLTQEPSTQAGEGDLVARLISGEGKIENFALNGLARASIEQAGVLAPLYRARKARDNGNDTEAENLFILALSRAHAAGQAEGDYLESQVYAHKKDYVRAADAFRRYLTAGGANAGFTGELAALMQTLGGQQGQQEMLRQRQRTLGQAFCFMVRVKAFKEARGYLDELMQIAGENWWNYDTQPWLNLGDCGEMHEGLGELDRAFHYYERAIAELEARRNQMSRDELKTALAAGTGPQYLYFQAARAALAAAEKAGEALRAKTLAAHAFACIERGKSRALLDLMAGSVAIAGSATTEGAVLRSWRQRSAGLALWRGLLAQERKTRNPDLSRIGKLEEQIKDQQEKLGEVEEQLARSDPDFSKILAIPAEVMGAEKVCAELPSDAVLLQYAFLGEDLLTWALTSQGILKFNQAAVDAGALGRHVRDFHKACMEKRETSMPGSRLTEVFLSPMKDVIEEHSRLFIVPYGPAHTLPFHALPFQGKPLGEEHVISYLPSASTLQFLHEENGKGPRDRILAVGNPAAMTYRHPLTNEITRAGNLRGAESEARYVASLFPQGKVLVGDEATAEELRPLLDDYPLLHLATHGVLSGDAPLLSAILLAHGTALSVYELMGLHVKADLVVLSACQTALGEITGGDDVIGFTRGLLAAGARAAIVSLWPVDDVSTSLFMGEFYRELRNGKSFAPSLHGAQNYLRRLTPGMIAAESMNLRDAGHARHLLPAGNIEPERDFSHPYYWAPFILVGS